MNAIVIDNLVHRFNPKTDPALQGLSVKIRSGRVTGLVGPDGAGKTTLLRLIAGLLVPTEGQLTVCGLDSVRQTDALHQLLGYMPQRFGLYEDLSVLENLQLYADLRAVIGDQRTETFARLLHFTGLEPFTQRLAGRLSGGMKQKLGLACALIQKPQLLLLDEPSVGVDPISRRELWNMVQSLIDDQVTVIWSTAYLDEAEQCAEVLLLNEGQLLFAGPPQELTDRVKGRSFLIRDIPIERKRPVLHHIQTQPEVLDTVVQGSAIHVLLKPNAQRPALNEPAARWEEVTPHFEDGFMDVLGQATGHESALAAGFDPIAITDRPVVEAQGLTKRFGDFTAVHNNSFSIRPGEIFGLLGPNGAGKSTTFKMMCGLLRPTEGHGTVAGLDLRHAASQARSRLGYMAQKFSLYGDLSVLQNLNFFAGVYGLRGRAKRQAAEEMLETFDLGSYARSSAGELPLGFKQRLSPGLCRYASSRSPVPGRADLGRRSLDPPGVLDSHQWPGGQGGHHPDHHPLHGRGRILRSHRPDLSR